MAQGERGAWNMIFVQKVNHEVRACEEASLKRGRVVKRLISHLLLIEAVWPGRDRCETSTA